MLSPPRVAVLSWQTADSRRGGAMWTRPMSSAVVVLLHEVGKDLARAHLSKQKSLCPDSTWEKTKIPHLK